MNPLSGSLASSIFDPLSALVGASGGVYALMGGYFMNAVVVSRFPVIVEGIYIFFRKDNSDYLLKYPNKKCFLFPIEFQGDDSTYGSVSHSCNCSYWCVHFHFPLYYWYLI